MNPRALILIVLLGIGLRLVFYIIAPPSNSYDDHLEAVSIHRSDDGGYQRASPDACWQCYQPPLFYIIANTILNSSSPDTEDLQVWKRVQGISFVASCTSLIFCVIALSILCGEGIDRSVTLFLSLLASLMPRLTFTSAMPTNDALLEMSVSLAVLGYVLASSNNYRSQCGYALILIGTLFSAYTKQSGLVLTVPLIALMAARLVYAYNPLRISSPSAFLGIIVVLVCFADELWRFSSTGLILASNQDFFDYAVGQRPGRLSDVSFLNLDLIGLLKNPFLSEGTLASFWTEIYGRLWFDYERRFFTDGDASHIVGPLIYVLALPIMAFLTASAFNLKAVLERTFLPAILLLICLGFFAVPILQTIRFPYYSSMKAVFVTAGITPILCLVSFGACAIARALSRYKVLYVMSFFMISISLLSIFLLVTTSSQAWSSGVSGPLWPLPVIGR